MVDAAPCTPSSGGPADASCCPDEGPALAFYKKAAAPPAYPPAVHSGSFMNVPKLEFAVYRIDQAVWPPISRCALQQYVHTQRPRGDCRLQPSPKNHRNMLGHHTFQIFQLASVPSWPIICASVMEMGMQGLPSNDHERFAIPTLGHILIARVDESVFDISNWSLLVTHHDFVYIVNTLG